MHNIYIYIFTTVHKVMRGRKSDSLNEIKRVARFFSPQTAPRLNRGQDKPMSLTRFVACMYRTYYDIFKRLLSSELDWSSS